MSQLTVKQSFLRRSGDCSRVSRLMNMRWPQPQAWLFLSNLLGSLARTWDGLCKLTSSMKLKLRRTMTPSLGTRSLRTRNTDTHPGGCRWGPRCGRPRGRRGTRCACRSGRWPWSSSSRGSSARGNRSWCRRRWLRRRPRREPRRRVTWFSSEANRCVVGERWWPGTEDLGLDFDLISSSIGLEQCHSYAHSIQKTLRTIEVDGNLHVKHNDSVTRISRIALDLSTSSIT